MLQDAEFQSTIFIVDALNECSHMQLSLINIISQSATWSEKVRWLVSSRPNTELSARFPNSELVLDVDNLRDPVDAYIHHQVSILEKEDNGYSKEVTDAIASSVSENAANTYLWVWLAFEQLKPDEDGNRLDENDALEAIVKFPPKLSDVYKRILANINKKLGNTSRYCKAALEAVHLAYRPLSIAELAVFIRFHHNNMVKIKLSNEKEIARVINECGSMLNVTNGFVNLIHKSASDYLREEYGPLKAPKDVALRHAQMGEDCLKTMDGLSRNMCGLQDVGSCYCPVTIPETLARMRYACVHWADHICDANDKTSGLEMNSLSIVSALSFLHKHLLHWLEALSILRRLPDGIMAMRKLQALQSQDTSELTGFVYDALHFTFAFRDCLEIAPLQVYVSALLFSPTGSKVRKRFQYEEPTWIDPKPMMKAEWPPLLQKLNTHGNFIRSIDVSPNGNQLASCSSGSCIDI